MKDNMDTPQELILKYLKIAEKKSRLTFTKLFILSILGGAFVALAAVGANAASCMIDNPGVSKLIGACIFPAGLVMIIVTGGELFTGDCLLTIPALDKRMKWGFVAKYWAVVYFGNFTGSILVALIAVYGGEYSLFSNTSAVAAISTAVSKTGISAQSGLLLGILCNFLVCVAVWMSYYGENITNKIAGAYFPVFLFVIAGFEHCIANMYYVPAGMLLKANPAYAEAAVAQGIDLSGLTVSNFILHNLIPVTIGNIIGGGVLVGAVYWFTYLKKEK